jgi:hypothetical protein
MKHFFSQVEDLPVNNSLINAESYFGDQKASGLIEKQINADRTAVLIVGGGQPCTAYTLENSICKSISLTEFSSLNNGISHLRAIKLPDTAGRMTWLALESEAKNKYSIGSDDAWKKQLDQWKQDRWYGLIEITSKTLHGFALLWKGEIQKPEIIFSTPRGFVSDFPQVGGADNYPWEVTTYAHTPSVQAYRCAILRQGAVEWSHQILSRYRSLVGQKLLQLMDRELNRQILPWQWNISLDENVMSDAHFFSSLSDATHAYRALFMAMGAQMDFVIGNMLTQRLLSETFEMIHPDERAVLQSERLIPAAFSE